MLGLVLGGLAACRHAPEAAPSNERAPRIDAALATADAPPASQEEQLAAIQKAMNELDEAVQGCWATAATVRFDIEGMLVLRVDIGAPTPVTVVPAKDTLRNPGLTRCVIEVATAYPWAPPLYGQAIQLPFELRAPDGQSVIDRARVSWVGQRKLAIAVLLDEHNAGNPQLSMLEVALEAGASTGERRAERAELWYFLGPATVAGYNGGAKQALAAGDMMFVPADGVRVVTATAGAVHAMVVITPGGREGSARAGALPTREVGAVRAAPPAPTVLRAATATVYARGAGSVRIYAEAATINDKAIAASVITLPAGADLATHTHGGETEALYVLAGAGTLTVGPTTLPFGPTSVIQIPANVPHAVAITSELRAVQLYTPAGPEQRFKRAP